jgi:hypothetical protein
VLGVSEEAIGHKFVSVLIDAFINKENDKRIMHHILMHCSYALSLVFGADAKASFCGEGQFGCW